MQTLKLSSLKKELYINGITVRKLVRFESNKYCIIVVLNVVVMFSQSVTIFQSYGQAGDKLDLALAIMYLETFAVTADT